MSGGESSGQHPVRPARTVNQIVGRYRECRHPVEKTRWHDTGLIARADVPRTPDPVADVVGLSGATVRAAGDAAAELPDEAVVVGHGSAPAGRNVERPLHHTGVVASC